jgi:hypothetical protein
MDDILDQFPSRRLSVVHNRSGRSRTNEHASAYFFMPIPLFDRQPINPVPIKALPADERSGGPGRPAGRRATARLRWTAVSTGGIGIATGTADTRSEE